MFAYAELHTDPSLEVRPELEPARTVPASRWRCHRDLLQAYAALAAQLPRSTVRAFRGVVSDLVRSGASYAQVETELGEFQALDAAHILSNCPFLWRTQLGSTYWAGDDTTATLDTEWSKARIDVCLATCRELTRAREFAEPFCITVCAYAPSGLLESDGIWVSATDLVFVTSVQPLEVQDDVCCFAAPRARLIERLPLVAARAAWAVGIRLEEDLRSPAYAEAALRAALELIRAMSVSSEKRVPSWQHGGAAARVMAVADVVRDCTAAVLAAFECVQRCLFGERVPPSRDRYLFDSKHFCAVSSTGVNKTLSISGSRYSVSLQVELEATQPSTNSSAAGGRAFRASTVRLRSERASLARKKSV